MTTRSAKATLPAAILALSLAACATGEKSADASDVSATTPAEIDRTCRALKRLMALGQKEVEEARGSVTRVSAGDTGPASTTYASKLQVPGWSDCTIVSFDDRSSDDPYIDHSLYCFSRELPGSRASRQYVSDIYACTGAMFSERTLTEARLGSRYILIGFEGEATPEGRGVQVDFGETSYVVLGVETDIDWQDVDVTIAYQFLKKEPKDRATDGDTEEIVLTH